MDTKKQLTIGMALLFFFVISFFGIVIVNFKSKELLLPKVQEKVNSYIKDTYSDIYNDIRVNKTKYNSSKNVYETKVISKDNKNLYFTISYKNKKFKNTYKEDYLKGNSLFQYYENLFIKKLSSSKKYTDISIHFTKDLNKYGSIVKKALLEGDDINNLSIYIVKSSTVVDNFNQESMINSINDYYQFIKDNDLNPKYYSIILTNKEDITNSLELENLSEELIINNLEDIIYGITNNNKNIINQYKINYKYID